MGWMVRTISAAMALAAFAAADAQTPSALDSLIAQIRALDMDVVRQKATAS